MFCSSFTIFSNNKDFNISIAVVNVTTSFVKEWMTLLGGFLILDINSQLSRFNIARGSGTGFAPVGLAKINACKYVLLTKIDHGRWSKRCPTLVRPKYINRKVSSDFENKFPI